uniref:Uncharacterized protein n=1 Tax=Kalanchoe fedtschenkoi TaxID=63787 RepID=A0A7N0TFC4_KALFE
MQRSANATSRGSSDDFRVDFTPAAKAYQFMDRLDSSEDLPLYSPVAAVEDLKKDINLGHPASSGDNTIHLIPIILFICALILWLFSRPTGA